MIDRTRIPPNMGIHEYLMHLDEPRERPIPNERTYPVDHSRRDWILYEQNTLKQIEDMPQADELVRFMLVTAKKRNEVKRELSGILKLLTEKEKR